MDMATDVMEVDKRSLNSGFNLSNLRRVAYGVRDGEGGN